MPNAAATDRRTLLARNIVDHVARPLPTKNQPWWFWFGLHRAFDLSNTYFCPRLTHPRFP
jgi:hypothetical protein